MHVVEREEHGQLVRAVLGAVEASGGRILRAGTEGVTPLRVRFETPEGERVVVLVYAVRALLGAGGGVVVQAPTGDAESVDELWHDEDGVITTPLIAIDLERGVFGGADTLAHEGTAGMVGLRVAGCDVEEAAAGDGVHGRGRGGLQQASLPRLALPAPQRRVGRADVREAGRPEHRELPGADGPALAPALTAAASRRIPSPDGARRATVGRSASLTPGAPNEPRRRVGGGSPP
jgi:hypothetical protein